MLDKRHRIIILVGASGTGKSTVQHLLQRHYHICPVVTHTTRLPRQGERNGADYYFETKRSFFNLHLIEHTCYGGHYYGSSLEGLHRAFAKSNAISIILDNIGVQKYCRKFSGHCLVAYFQPMDYQNAFNRLKEQNRNTSDIDIKRRLNRSENVLPSSFINSHRVLMMKSGHSKNNCDLIAKKMTL